jgi:MraZ protein
MDGKGRLTVPARFKDDLMTLEEGQLVVCKNTSHSLQLFPRSVWLRLETKLMALDATYAELRRFLIGSAADLTIDGASRINVPPELREWAGLERDVIFMGVGKNFELWDKGRLTAHEEKVLREQDMTARMTGLVID